MTRTQYTVKGQATRERILNAALQIIATEGMHKVSARRIAKHGKVALSAVTYYFSDMGTLKEEAFAHYVEQNRVFIQELREKAAQILKDTPKVDVPEKIAGLLWRFSEKQNSENPNLQVLESAILHSALVSDRIRELVIKQRSEYYSNTIEWFENLGSKEADVSSYLFLAVIFYVERWGSINPDFRNEGLQKRIFTALFEALLKQ